MATEFYTWQYELAQLILEDFVQIKAHKSVGREKPETYAMTKIAF